MPGKPILTMRLRSAPPDAAPTLVLLDQRALPSSVEYVELSSAAAVAAAIKDMVVRGAPAIGCAAAYGYYLGAHAAAAASRGDAAAFDAAMGAVHALLLGSRPTAVNLRWALDRLRAAAAGLAPEAAVAALLEEAGKVYEEDVAACMAMGRFGRDLVKKEVFSGTGARVVHHCNTGSLATSAYGTALGLIRAVAEVDPSLHVYDLDVAVCAPKFAVALTFVAHTSLDSVVFMCILAITRPRLQGARLTAWELVQEEISHELIVDSAAAVLMAAGKVNYCVVGSDRIAADGSVANKIGTYSLAVNASFHKVPFIVVAPTSTIDLDCPTGSDIPIEQRPGDEVTHPCGVGAPGVAPEATAVFNPAFDVTPPSLVAYIVTEVGVARRDSFASDLAELCAKAKK